MASGMLEECNNEKSMIGFDQHQDAISGLNVRAYSERVHIRPHMSPKPPLYYSTNVTRLFTNSTKKITQNLDLTANTQQQQKNIYKMLANC